MKRGNAAALERPSPPINDDDRGAPGSVPARAPFSTTRHSGNPKPIPTNPSLILNGVLLILNSILLVLYSTRNTKTLLSCDPSFLAPTRSRNYPLHNTANATTTTITTTTAKTTTTTTSTTTSNIIDNQHRIATRTSSTGSNTSYNQPLIATSTTIGYVRYDKIVGHLHYAKTVGTEINGELAAHYERVCGHKGYSYDSAQFNYRVKKMKESTGNMNLMMVGGRDVISATYREFNRGRVLGKVMDEIGYEDCDYISLEDKWQKWEQIAPLGPLELHVPCREPLDHLMSQCNMLEIDFLCTEESMARSLEERVRQCMIMPDRFALGLTNIPNLTMKCFNPLPVTPYLEYMDHILQRKRIESEYVRRTSNNPRNKTLECIWNDEDVADRVLKILQTYDYYSWCEKCMGSEHDILGLPWK